MFIVPPDAQYLEYFDLRTLSCLFGTLAVVCALSNIWFFRSISGKIVQVFHNTRSVILALTYITLFGSMLIANDMALITFLPLSYFVLESTDNRKYLAFTFVMQNVAANLGGMLTPFGNPQNLYLYSYFGIPNGEFVSIMLFPFILAFTLITLLVFLFVKPDVLAIHRVFQAKLSVFRTTAYLILFALSIAIVFNVIHYLIGIGIIIAVLLVMDRKALLQVDYGLLLTFCAFFIFSGNMARIPAINDLIGGFVSRSTLLSGVISCQFISNVPTAILLSKFTENYADLLISVNIGGVGTLISSLASLITFRRYMKVDRPGIKKYLLIFTLINFALLIIMTLVVSFM
ncbi:MAG: citrate transporter [Clostridia bacterium]|nr:citrate transporter [Clostridia bacterium]